MILDGAKRVRISGQDIDVRAQIRRTDSCSAHADQAELLDWITARGPVAGSLFLTHGEPEAVAALAELVHELDPSLSIVTPESYLVAPGAPASRVRSARADVARLSGREIGRAHV